MGMDSQSLVGDLSCPVQVLYNKLCFLPLGKGVRSRQLKP